MTDSAPEVKSKTLVARCKETFFNNGEKASDIIKEMKELSPADKQELVDAFNAEGIPTHLKA